MGSIIIIFKNFWHKLLQLIFWSSSRTDNALYIYIKTNTGSTVPVQLEPDLDIRNVKGIVAPKLGLRPEEVKIIFAGKELSDATTLAVCTYSHTNYSKSPVLWFLVL